MLVENVTIPALIVPACRQLFIFGGVAAKGVTKVIAGPW